MSTRHEEESNRRAIAAISVEVDHVLRKRLPAEAERIIDLETGDPERYLNLVGYYGDILFRETPTIKLRALVESLQTSLLIQTRPGGMLFGYLKGRADMLDQIPAMTLERVIEMSKQK